MHVFCLKYHTKPYVIDLVVADVIGWAIKERRTAKVEA